MRPVERADITYPTDIGILNQARLQTEKRVDILYKPSKDKFKNQPRTYRNQGRKDYLAIAKQRRASRSQKITALKKQLQYLILNPLASE